MNLPIETDRLILRQFTVDDARSVSYNSKRPRMAHYLSDMIFQTEQEALAWINWINHDKFNIQVPNAVLAVVLKQTNQCIGLIGLAPKQELEDEVEILFGLADEHQSHGYITEAGHALIDWAFKCTPLQTLVALAQHDNVPSNLVLKKLGLAYCGEKSFDYCDRMTDFHYYRLEKPKPLERMDDFFTARVDGYDNHMLDEVEGCKNGYQKMAELLPCTAVNLLDLGCGTGLELDSIFKLYPHLEVTGVDLTKAMLDKLKQKHSDKNLTLVNQSYFDYDFGEEKYDAVVSFQTMHHFEHEAKAKLYSRICTALKEGGVYIECDYMVVDPKEEAFYFDENRRIRRELQIPLDAFYHYDTPCTIENQINLFLQAGFTSAKMMFREENTTIIVARKVV